MKNLLITLTGAALLTATAAIAADEKYHSETDIKRGTDGSYESNTEVNATDAAGTAVKKELTTEVDVDADGDKETSVKYKTTRDPKGLMNKSTTETERTTKEDGSSTTTTYKKKVDGEVVTEEKKTN